VQYLVKSAQKIWTIWRHDNVQLTSFQLSQCVWYLIIVRD